MQIHTSRNGEKKGPFNLYRIKEMLDEGELSLDDLGWHEGLDKWCPLKDIPVVASTLKSLKKSSPRVNVTVKSADKHSQKTEIDDRTSLPLPSRIPGENVSPKPGRTKNVHPLLRFWARIFDYLLFFVLVWLVFPPLQMPPPPDNPEDLLEFFKNFYKMIPREELQRVALIQIGALFVWNFIEALLISSFGTTPGKMLFNIKVTRNNGSLLSYSEAMGRSILVWVLGLGIGFQLLPVMTMIFSLFFLLNKGETLWDRTLKAQVHHQPLSPQRIVFAIGAYFIIFSLQSLSLS